MRPGCDRPAAARLSYDTISCQVWLDQVPERLGPVQEICQFHAERLTVPRGWMLCDRRVDAPALFEPDDRVTPLVAPPAAASTRAAGPASTAGATTTPRRAHRRRHPSSTARQLFDDEPRRIAEVVAPVGVEVDLDSDLDLELHAATPIDLDSDLESDLDETAPGVVADAVAPADVPDVAEVIAIVAPAEPVLQVVAAPAPAPVEEQSDVDADLAAEPEPEAVDQIAVDQIEAEELEIEIEAAEPLEAEPEVEVEVELEVVAAELDVEVVVVDLDAVAVEERAVEERAVEAAAAAGAEADVAGGLDEVLVAASRNGAAKRPMPEHAEIMAEIVSVDPDDELPESLRATSPLLARAFRATGPQRSVLSPDLANPPRDEPTD